MAAKNILPLFALLCLPLLACYNGKSGSRKLKYLFYVFYPAHLAILYGISMLLEAVKGGRPGLTVLPVGSRRR